MNLSLIAHPKYKQKLEDLISRFSQIPRNDKLYCCSFLWSVGYSLEQITQLLVNYGHANAEITFKQIQYLKSRPQRNRRRNISTNVCHDCSSNAIIRISPNWNYHSEQIYLCTKCEFVNYYKPSLKEVR